MEGLKQGGFPFPLVVGPRESRYLTWIRNHSNYMAEGGLVDYMRIVAILIRGILVNFLTLVPYLLAAALLLGVLYNPMLDRWRAQGDEVRAANASLRPSAEWAEIGELPEAPPPDWIFPTRELGPRPQLAANAPAFERFWAAIGSWPWTVPEFLHQKLKLPRTEAPYLLTPIVALIGLGYFLLFPVVTRLFKVVSHKRSLETGSGSSVKLRDRYERSFGGALIVFGGVLVIESLPLLIHNFHEARTNEWRGVAASLAGVGAVLALSSAGKVVDALGGLKQKLIMAAVGLVGLLLPLLVILYVDEFLVYYSEGFETSFASLIVIPGLLAVGILAALLLGLSKGALQHAGWLLRLLLYVALAVGLLKVLDYFEVLGGGWFLIVALMIEIWLFCSLAVDINLTSVHGLYRDRLASAYLVGEDVRGDVDIEEDIDLHDIALYQAFSRAPYHLINVAHNLQASKDIGIRERNSDFFVFSKRFIGGQRTGYCRSEALEKVFPQMDLATAMAISAAAAAPNMGANTSRAMVALLTLLNVRLGYWIPNPGHIEAAAKGVEPDSEPRPGLDFGEVFAEELADVRSRWRNLATGSEVRDTFDSTEPSPDHGLIGVGFSGGGIRSATINLGLAQTLHRAGVFEQVDYMSTVSGGGYLGSSISTLMRSGERLYSEVSGRATVSEGEGTKTITVTPEGGEPARTYVFRGDAQVCREIEEEQRVEKGRSLIRHRIERGGLGDRFDWRVRPSAFVREMFSRLDETHKWVNLSDGGHLENLAAIELLRRRCRFILIGDGEADPNLHFGSLARLIRFARLDLGVRIDIDPAELRLVEGCSTNHIAVGRIRYPKLDGSGWEPTEGRLLYLKSSFTGDEEEVIQQYRNACPDFPHETTADQFFDEGQFEAYRSLGQHIGELALRHAPGGEAEDVDLMELWLKKEAASGAGVSRFFDEWFRNLETALPNPWKASSAA